MAEPFPSVEPYDRGLLDVGDGRRIHRQVSGHTGSPAMGQAILAATARFGAGGPRRG